MLQIGLVGTSRCLWLSHGLKGLSIQFQDDDHFSARFGCLKDDLELVALGAAIKAEYWTEDRSQILRIGWRGGLVVEWETDERTIREDIVVDEFLSAVKAIG